MAVYRHDRRRRITLVVLIISSLVLITLDQQNSAVVGSVRDAAHDVISPFQDVADDAISPVGDFFDSLGRANELEAENERLRQQITGLQAQVAAGQEARTAVDELRRILDLPRIEDFDGVVASVVDGSTGNFERTFQIDKGSDAGIAENMSVVVGSQGGALVGRVASVSKSRATVERLDDPRFHVFVQLLNADATSGPVGQASGQRNSAFLELQLSGTEQNLTRGQFAITRGLGLSPFPRGLVVGTVEHDVDASTATAERAPLRPVVDLDRLNIVKVLRYQPKPPS